MRVSCLAVSSCLLLGCAGSPEQPRAPRPASDASPSAIVLDVTSAPFLARGDGVADDGDAIQRAIRTAASAARREGGAVLRIPAGVYRVTSRLRLVDETGAPANGLEIRGDGRATVLAFDHRMADRQGIAVAGDGVTNLTVRDLRITAAAGGAGFNRGISIHGGERITLRDLDVSGAWLTSVGGRPFGYPSGIFVDGGASDVRILDNSLHDNGNDDGNSWHLVIYTSGGATHVQIAGNRCVNPPHASHRANIGIGVFNSSYVTLERNFVEGISGTAHDVDGYGIMLYGSGAGLSHHHVVDGNTVRATGGIGIYVQGSPYSVVQGNLLEDTARTQSSTTLAAAAITFNQGPGTITGNVIRGVGVGTVAANPPSGIAIQTCSGALRCAPADGTPRGIAVSSNTIEDTAGYGIAVEAGPSNAADNSTIVGNTLINTGGGIASVGDAPLAGLVVLGNSIVRASRARSGGAPGIALAHLAGSVVANNVIVEPDGQGIVLEKDAQRNVISGNVVRAYGRSASGSYAGIQVAGAGNLITGNQTVDAGAAGRGWGVSEAGAANQILFNNVMGENGTKAPGILSTGTRTIRAQNRMAADATEEGPVTPPR